MPKLGMKPIRRASLVEATITEIGLVGSLDVTVGQIAKRAGVSSALAHHYFGAKDQLFLAAMRHILAVFGAQVRVALTQAETPQARIEAIVQTCFDSSQFQPEVIGAWLNFYVRARTSPPVNQLLRIYQGRLRSNLIHALRPLVGPRASDAAEALAAMIDGIYIRQALGRETIAPKTAIAQTLRYLTLELNTLPSNETAS